MASQAQLEDKRPDPHEMLVDIGRLLQSEEPDIKAALALIRPALRALTTERDDAASRLESYKMMQADDRGVQAIMPRSPAEAFEYARSMCAVGHVPSAYREGGKRDGAPILGLVALGIMKAMEIGVPPQTGLGNLLPINDRFAVWGDLAQGLVQRQNVIEAYHRELVNPKAFDLSGDVSMEWPTDVGYYVRFKRRGVEGFYEHEYTIADAKRARLWLNAAKKPWISDPMRMLFNRARAFALRDGFSDCLFGLAIREEIDDWDEPKPKQISTDFLSDDAPEAAASEEATDAE